MSPVGVVIVMSMSVLLGALVTWLVMTFRRSRVIVPESPACADIISKLAMQVEYYEQRGNYYERFAKMSGLRRRDRFASFPVWKRSKTFHDR